MRVLSGVGGSVVKVATLVCPNGAPVALRIVGSTVIENCEPAVSVPAGVKVTTLPTVLTLPATAVPVVWLLTRSAPLAEAPSIATSNVAVAWKPVIGICTSCGSMTTVVGGSGVTMRSPKLTFSSGTAARLKSEGSPTPVGTVRPRSANAPAGCACTGTAKMPPVRATSMTPSDGSKVLPLPEATSAPRPADRRRRRAPGPRRRRSGRRR